VWEPRPIATTEVPERSPSSGKPSKRFYPAMSSGRCPVPPAGADGGLLRTRFTSLLPRLRLRQSVLDLPPLRSWTALLQPAVPPTSVSTTAAPRQPPPPTKHRRTTRSPGPSAGVSPTPTHARVTDQGSLRSSFRCRILLQATTPTPVQRQSRPGL
jgi:hypothetical protein